ncbi:MAG: 16S rRNA (cytosine(1402)-N(4))-methyltransferase RsmH [Clostridia bacterium]|nr:16S rRNA (cytosine(1402)-N(4))-methyltransferase RsmH [Clostridia bacterium]MBR3991564.1 16S rRNA (cytosine(1402)-N(4))-methyltransferase RsmH [Clostridia bacterium]
MEFRHASVLLHETVDALSPERGGTYVDCTAGGGGHSYEIARRLPEGGRLISLDRDPDAIAAATERLRDFGDRVTLVKSDYSDVGAVLDDLGAGSVNGVMWDLGVSSFQLDEGERGFSYMKDAPLDMRMDRSGGITAADVVNGYSAEELKRIIWEYGEEKFAGPVARNIVKAREKKRIETTGELAALIAEAMPAAARRAEAQHPAKRTFQAIRIEVNGELDQIEPSIRAAVERLSPGGIAAVITFHSLEDRIVKRTFADLSTGCTCPPGFPVCVCGRKPVVEPVTKKPVVPSRDEEAENPRARSAKLRIVRKL